MLRYVCLVYMGPATRGRHVVPESRDFNNGSSSGILLARYSSADFRDGFQRWHIDRAHRSPDRCDPRR